jgi:hypothetical protein
MNNTLDEPEVNWSNVALDLTQDLQTRLDAFSHLDQKASEELCCLAISQFSMSEISILAKMLEALTELPDLDPMIHLKIAQAFAESTIHCTKTGPILESLCKRGPQLPTPCRIDSILLLLPHQPENALKFFKQVINQPDLDCAFRYVSILRLEQLRLEGIRDIILESVDNHPELCPWVYKTFREMLRREFPEYNPASINIELLEFILGRLNLEQLSKILTHFDITEPSQITHFLYDSLFSFVQTSTNASRYRILGCQYLLGPLLGELTQREERELVQQFLVTFAVDEELDTNIRADAADVLQRLGDSESKVVALRMLGELGGGETKTVFENTQNVHVQAIEESATHILEHLSSLKTLHIAGQPITLEYIKKKLCNILQPPDSIHGCTYCENYPNVWKENWTPGWEVDVNHCSDECLEAHRLVVKLVESLQRIELDRVLYTHYNMTLERLLIKLWTYIQNSKDDREALEERLLQELEEMAGTCSSGFASRLANTLSGFGDFLVGISWESQIAANLTGRLNAAARNLADPDVSLFASGMYKDHLVDLSLNPKLYVELENSVKGDLGSAETVTREQIRTQYLSTVKSLQELLEEFSEQVLVEMTVASSENRQRFGLFFRSHIAKIREEMYKEFKDHMDDTDFDLYMRRALMVYDGLKAS